MDFLRKQLDRFRAETSTLLSKLSTSQKISIGLLALIVALAMVLIVRTNIPDEYVTLSASADTGEVEAMRSLLESNNIDYQLESAGQNATRIGVPRAELGAARWLAMDSGVFSDRDSHLNWLFGEPDILDTNARLSERLLVSRRRSVEDTITAAKKIVKTSIVIQKGPEPIFAKHKNATGTASVSVTLKAGVDRLTNKDASTIRNLVKGAFNLLPQNIQVSDNNLNSYPYVETFGHTLTEEEDRTQTRVLQTLQRVYNHMFLPSEFVLGVLVDVDQTRSEVLEEVYDPEGVVQTKEEVETSTEKGGSKPGQPPGVGPNAGATGQLGGTATAVGGQTGRTETEDREKKRTVYSNRFSKRTRETNVPPGRLKGISVNLVLDRDAVLRKIKEEGKEIKDAPTSAEEKQEIAAAIAQYEAKHKKIIEVQLPMSNAKVHVSTVSFPKPYAQEVVALSGTFMGWFSEHWKDVSLGVLVVLGLFLFYGIIKKSLPAPIEIPSLEERVLMHEDQAQRDAVEQLREQIRTFTQEEEQPGEEVSENELENDLKKINDISQSRPESVAAVLRTWMSGATVD